MKAKRKTINTLLIIIAVLLCSCRTAVVFEEEPVAVVQVSASADTEAQPAGAAEKPEEAETPQVPAAEQKEQSGEQVKQEQEKEENINDPEPTPETPEKEPETPAPEVQDPKPDPEAAAETPSYKTGDIGTYGGPLFCMDGKWYELGEITEVSSWDEAKEKCSSIEDNDIKGFRLPTTDELLAIYDELFDPWLWEIDETYYWSGEEDGEASAFIVNFATGFKGSFFKDMDFLSAMFVREIRF